MSGIIRILKDPLLYKNNSLFKYKYLWELFFLLIDDFFCVIIPVGPFNLTLRAKANGRYLMSYESGCECGTKHNIV